MFIRAKLKPILQKLGISEKGGLQPIYVILLAGIALRLPFIFTTSYTHDELSALYRLPQHFLDLFSTQSLVDAHPPFIQVFLYLYTSVFGTTEWVVKLPFALAGLFSIVVLYRIGKHHYSENAGLFAAAVMAVAQLYLYHSVVIRPYIPGVLFCLLFTEKWLKLIRQQEFSYKDKTWYLTYAMLCILTHHLCTLHVLLTVLVGLIPSAKKSLFPYLKLHLVLLILSLPALYIINFQLQFKGIGSWLAPPEQDFFVQFLAYLFHYSYLFIGCLLFCLMAGIWFLWQQPIHNRQYSTLLALVFVLAFLIAYCYSVYRAPIIQFSLLQFSLPFFLLWVFQLTQHIRSKYFLYGLLGLVLSSGIYSAFYHRHHHELLRDFHYTSFAQFIEANSHYKNKLIISSDRKEFYERYISTKDFYFTYGKENPWLLVQEKIKAEKPEVVFSDNNDFVTFSLLKSFYPYVYEVKEGIGNNFFILGRRPLLKPHYWDTALNVVAKYPSEMILDSNREFFNLLDTNAQALYDQQQLQFVFESHMSGKNENPCLLVIELYNGTERKFWYGAELFVRVEDSSYHYCYSTFDLTPEIKKLAIANTQIKAYLWNSRKKKTSIKDIKVGFKKPNTRFFGLVEDIYW